MTISSYSSIGMMPPVSNISKDIVAQNDKNSDSSLSIEELGIDEEQFSTLDSDGDGLVTQNEIASAIDSKLSSFDGQMPSKEEFETLISELGLQMPEPPVSPQANDFSSMIMSSYDTDSDSLLSSSEVSILSEEEFSALDTNSDGSISTDELSSAYDKVTSSSESSGTMASMPPPSGGAYDELDTNKDGIVSQEEKNAALGISSEDTISSSSTSNEDVKNTLKMLLDTIKLNAQNSSENIDLSSFKNIMQMMNNQTNNSELNSYVKNLSNSNSSLLNYA